MIRMIPILFAAIATMLLGCATGQQGQGPVRQTNVSGPYIENMNVTVGAGDRPLIGDVLNDRTSAAKGTTPIKIDQRNTYQPVAEGEASPTNSPTTSTELSLPLVP